MWGERHAPLQHAQIINNLRRDMNLLLGVGRDAMPRIHCAGGSVTLQRNIPVAADHVFPVFWIYQRTQHHIFSIGCCHAAGIEIRFIGQPTLKRLNARKRGNSVSFRAGGEHDDVISPQHLRQPCAVVLGINVVGVGKDVDARVLNIGRVQIQ
jgi:hypothetical protein